MSTVLVDMPARLVVALNGQTWPMTPTVSYGGYAPVLSIAATEDPAIWVTPRRKVRRRISRDGRCEHGITLEILVQRECGVRTGEDDPVARADEITTLAEAVEDYLFAAEITPAVESGTPEWRAKTKGDVEMEFSQERYAAGTAAWVITATFWLEK